MTRERILWATLALSASAAWYVTLPPAQPPVSQYVAATPAPELERVEKVTIKPAGLKVYAPKAKAALNLPTPVVADESVYVLGASKLSASERPRTIVTTLDSDTGEVRQDVRNDPLPWLAAESRGYVWAGVGIKANGERVGRVAVGYDVLAIKALHVGTHATLDNDGSAFFGIGVTYRW